MRVVEGPYHSPYDPPPPPHHHHHHTHRVKDVRYSSTSYQQRYHQLFGVPLVVVVPRECTYSDIYQAVLNKGR